MKRYSNPWKTAKPATPTTIARSQLARMATFTANEYPSAKRVPAGREEQPERPNSDPRRRKRGCHQLSLRAMDGAARTGRIDELVEAEPNEPDRGREEDGHQDVDEDGHGFHQRFTSVGPRIA